MATIYVYLLNEGTDSWRPSNAVQVGPKTYRLEPDKYDPEDEEWEFTPGTIVECEPKMFQSGETALVAVRLAG